jgi:aspartate/tyrosine/aromatic aminotransferase
MQWYWEHSHYRKQTGDLMLDRIFKVEVPGRTLFTDFGVAMTGATIEAHIMESRKRQEAWRKDQDVMHQRIARSAQQSRTYNRQPEATCW